MTSSEEYAQQAEIHLGRAGHAITADRMSAHAAAANAYAQLATAAAIREQTAATHELRSDNRDGEWA